MGNLPVYSTSIPTGKRNGCFSKTEQMHDIVLGLFVNLYAFGRAV